MNRLTRVLGVENAELQAAQGHVARPLVGVLVLDLERVGFVSSGPWQRPWASGSTPASAAAATRATPTASTCPRPTGRP